MKILQRIERVIKLTNNMMSEHPSSPMFNFMLRNLEALKIEFSNSDLDKEKISNMHYGFMRAYQEILEFEHTPFGEEAGKLLVELNEFDV